MKGNLERSARRFLHSTRTFAAAILLVPVLASAAPVVMIDAVPSGAEFVNFAKVQVPIKDLEKADSREVEAGLSSIVAQMVRFAEQNGATHICLLSNAAGPSRRFMVEAAQAQLTLQNRGRLFRRCALSKRD